MKNLTRFVLATCLSAAEHQFFVLLVLATCLSAEAEVHEVADLVANATHALNGVRHALLSDAAFEKEKGARLDSAVAFRDVRAHDMYSGNASDASQSPMVVFLLSPMTSQALEKIQARVKEVQPKAIDIYTMSDTLRCGQQDEVGGQLNSTKDACETLLNKTVEEITLIGNIPLGFKFQDCRITKVQTKRAEWTRAIRTATTELWKAIPLKVSGPGEEEQIDTTRKATRCKDVGDAAFLTILNSVRPLRLVTVQDYLKTPPGYFDLFGDQFNQAWLAKEWGSVMAWILELRKQIRVHVYIYPTQLLTNDRMFEVMREFGPGTGCHRSFKPDVGALHRYQKNWMCSTTGMLSHPGYHSKLPIFDLGPVMDFILFNSPRSERALRQQALDAEWCVQKQPNNKTNAKMVYVDIKKKLVGHCREPVADALVSDDVKVVVPAMHDKVQKWAEDFRGALREAFKLDGPDGIETSETKTMDAIIVQDSLYPDNPISVVWLLKKARFKSVVLVSVSQPVNFNTRKMRPLLKGSQYNPMLPNASQWAKVKNSSVNDCTLNFWLEGRSNAMVSFIADYDSRCREGSPCASKEGKPFGYADLHPNTTRRVFQEFDVNKRVAWPSLLSAEGAVIPQDAVNADDSKLMEKHNMWRWHEWFKRYGIFFTGNNSQDSVQIVSGGYPEMSPMSHALVPYTHFFFNENSSVEGPGWIVDPPTYERLEDKVTMEKRELVIPRSTQLLEEAEQAPRAHEGEAKVSQSNQTAALIPDFLKSAAAGYAGAVFWRIGLLAVVLLSLGF